LGWRDHPQTLRSVLAQERINDRTLRLAVRTPVRPEEEEHDIALEVVEAR
jgi:hypothetical protein